MIDEKKLAELRVFNQTMHSETDWLNFFHGYYKEMLDTLEFLWKENAELKEDRELLETYEVLSMKQLEQIKKLEAVARVAAQFRKTEQLTSAYSVLEEDALDDALAALKEKP